MLYILFILLRSISASQTVNCKLGPSKCSKDCIAFEKGNVKDCSSSKTGVEIILQSERKNGPKTLCKNCYSTAKLISKIKENKKLHESTVTTKGAASITLLRDVEAGYYGVKLASSYFLISSSNAASLFEKYKLLKLSVDELNGTFGLTGDSIDLPCDLEKGFIVYFGLQKGTFLLCHITGETLKDIPVSIKGVTTYIKPAYYVFLSMALIWIGFTMFRVRRDIFLKLASKNEAVEIVSK